MNHMTHLKLPEATTEFDQQSLANIRQYGWFSIEIPEDQIGPSYVFTVGFYYSYNHPEVLVMGLEADTARVFLNAIAEGIKAGTKYIDGSTDNDLASFPIAFKRISSSRYHDYLGYANWFYGSSTNGYPAVQFVWPDKAGLFPWDHGYNIGFAKRQTELWLD